MIFCLATRIIEILRRPTKTSQTIFPNKQKLRFMKKLRKRTEKSLGSGGPIGLQTKSMHYLKRKSNQAK